MSLLSEEEIRAWMESEGFSHLGRSVHQEFGIERRAQPACHAFTYVLDQFLIDMMSNLGKPLNLLEVESPRRFEKTAHLDVWCIGGIHRAYQLRELGGETSLEVVHEEEMYKRFLLRYENIYTS